MDCPTLVGGRHNILSIPDERRNLRGRKVVLHVHINSAATLPTPLPVRPAHHLCILSKSTFPIINIFSKLTMYLQKSCNQRWPFFPWTCKGCYCSLSSCLTNSGRHQRVCPTETCCCPLMIWKNPLSAAPPGQRSGCTHYIKRITLLLIDCIRAMESKMP